MATLIVKLSFHWKSLRSFKNKAEEATKTSTLSIWDQNLRLLLRLVVAHLMIGGARGRAITYDYKSI